MSQSVRRALEVVELLAGTPRSPSDVAEVLDTHRSTALRLLQTLVDAGYARRLPDGRYSLGYRMIGLAQRAQEQFDLRTIGHPHLVELTAQTGCTTHLAAIDNGHVVYVDKVEPTDSPRILSQIGRPVPLHTASAAKAILAHLPSDRLDLLLDGWAFTRHSVSTITTREGFLADLAAARDRGYAIDDGEYEDYINCIAVPVRDATGDVVASVSVTALRALRDLTSLVADLPRLRQAATDISRDLGWVANRME